jgi:NADPH-dependent curcumin reductase CurA
MLLRTLWLSLDPYMRGRMNEGKSYASPVAIGDVMVGGTVSEVVTSNIPGFVAGDIVEGRTGWQEYALPLLSNFARVPVCGLIAHYNDTELPAGPNRVPLLMRAILTNRLTVRGFLRGDFIAQQGAFFDDIVGWIREDKIKYREDVVEGLEEAPKAFQKLFRGDNLGKLLVRVAAE